MRESMTKRQEEDLIYEDIQNRSDAAPTHAEDGFYTILIYILKKFAGWMILLMMTSGNEEAMKGIIALWVFADIAKLYLSKVSLEI